MSASGGYLGARQHWDDRCQGIIASARNWRLMALVSSAVTIAALCAVGFLFASSRHRIIPYVIGVDQLGHTVFAGLATEQRVDRPRLMRAEMYNFVGAWRTVSSDWNAQSRAVTDVVFAHIADGSPARAAIEAWYREAPPQERIKSGSVTVEVKSILPISDKAYEAEWIERTWEHGSMRQEEHWRGSFSVVVSPPGDERQAYLNPLGLYIAEASWTKVL